MHSTSLWVKKVWKLKFETSGSREYKDLAEVQASNYDSIGFLS